VFSHQSLHPGKKLLIGFVFQQLYLDALHFKVEFPDRFICVRYMVPVLAFRAFEVDRMKVIVLFFMLDLYVEYSLAVCASRFHYAPAFLLNTVFLSLFTSFRMSPVLRPIAAPLFGLQNSLNGTKFSSLK